MLYVNSLTSSLFSRLHSRVASIIETLNPRLIPLPPPTRLSIPSDTPSISELRLSVFSTSLKSIRTQFLQKSSLIISSRSALGAIRIIALGNSGIKINEGEFLTGSLELTFHEFEGCKIETGKDTYLTEFCVLKSSRCNGIGGKLLKSVDTYCSKKNIERVYLHVEKKNTDALSVYKKAGYEVLKEHDNFYEFSDKLGLGEGRHYLMRKGRRVEGDMGFII